MTETAVLTLTEFLLARIAEDEALARELVAADVFAPTQGPDMSRLREDDEYAQLTIGAGRVLAECEAKRAIVAEHQPVDSDPGAWCERCVDRDTWPCPTMAALTLPYADHPDNPGWRP